MTYGPEMMHNVYNKWEENVLKYTSLEDKKNGSDAGLKIVYEIFR